MAHSPQQQHLRQQWERRRQDEYLAAKLDLLQVINRQREEAGVPPVQLDAPSSYAADLHCREMLARGFHAHLDPRGLAPYHRLVLAGVTDYVVENLITTPDADEPRRRSPDFVLSAVLAAHHQLMHAGSESDGSGGGQDGGGGGGVGSAQRTNVLDPQHTHVGLGLAFGRYGGVRLAEEFLNRYVAFDALPRNIAPPITAVTVTGRVVRSGYRPVYCGVYHQPLPVPHSPDELNASEGTTGLPPKGTGPGNGCSGGMTPMRRVGYSLPEELVCEVWPHQIRFDDEYRSFRFAVELGPHTATVVTAGERCARVAYR